MAGLANTLVSPHFLIWKKVTDLTSKNKTENGKYTQAVEKLFFDAVKEYNMIEDGDVVLTAFSGGADSCALLDLLCRFIGADRTRAIHVNHGIRGEEADADEAFCRSFCHERGVALTVIRADIPSIAKEKGIGIEEAARDFRYENFEIIADKYGCSKIAVAHNADDNLETVIFNLARGSGRSGLSGIPPVRDRIIRPLIFADKPSIVGYCTEAGIGFAVDSTNADTEYTRNFIRHSIIPQMKKLNPSVTTATTRSCRILREDSAYLDSIASNISEHTATSELASLPSPILKRFIINQYKKLSTSQQLESVHITDIVSVIRECPDRIKYISLPGRVRAVIGKSFSIEKAEKAACDTPSEAWGPIQLRLGENKLEHGDIIILSNNKKDIITDKNIYKLSIHTSVNSDKIVGAVYARKRQSGDTVRFGGMTRCVKKLFQAKKMPADQRAELPMICDQRGIIWVPGFPARDGLSNDGGKTLYIAYLKK